MSHKKDKSGKPLSCWIEKERFRGEIVDCLTIILRGKGCRWGRCLMCGFPKFSVGEEDLRRQIDYAFRMAEKKGSKPEILKIFTSGSFFDDNEIPSSFREYVYSKVEDEKMKKLIVESRPEFVFSCDAFDRKFELEVGIGLETSNDEVRELCVNKGFTFEDFSRAAKFLIECGARVRTYLLLKPPFLSEGEAVEDCLRSILECARLSSTISVNPVYVPKNSYIEKLWSAGIYRPPWLWSAVEVLKKASEILSENYRLGYDINLICDPVGAGSSRASHNCGKCDRDVADEIRRFSITQKIEFERSCECLEFWRKYIRYEKVARFDVSSVFT